MRADFAVEVRFAQILVAGVLLLVAAGLVPVNGWVGCVVALACCAGGFSASGLRAVMWWLLLGVGLVFLPPWWSVCLGVWLGSVVAMLIRDAMGMLDGSRAGFAAVITAALSFAVLMVGWAVHRWSAVLG